ncbi:MAG: hypothetical protein IJV72_08520 [Clostridia bacterium]|nr:hypothetical protein [Clostridia bacterium]
MKIKLICLISTLLILCTLLVSCGSVWSVGKVLNKDYDLSPDLYKTAVDLADLKGYTFDKLTVSDDLALFFKLDTENSSTSYKVLNLKDGTIVGTFEAPLNTFYTFEFFANSPVFFVSKAVVDSENIEAIAEDAKKAELLDILTKLIAGDLDIGEDVIETLKGYIDMTYMLYDSTGVEVATSAKANDAREFADMIIFNGVAYDINVKKGTLSKATDLPEYMDIGDCDFYNDEYFYMINGNKVTVYDRSFNHHFTYVAPRHGDDSIDDVYRYHVLNNGNILLQYTITQDEDTERYDLSFIAEDTTYKANLVSQLISIRSGKAKDLKLDYIVSTVMTNGELYDENESEEKNEFNDKFENIAFICPIEERKLMVSEEDIDIVLMSNNGKAKKSLKMIDHQSAEWATKISDDKYMVSTLDGGVSIIKSGGKVLNVMNNPLDLCGSYFVGERVIYTLDLNKAYDLYENDAEVLATMNRAILIKKNTDVGYDIIKLLDGKEETVYSHNDAESKTDFHAETGDNFYTIESAEGEYSYYNEKGENILISKNELEVFTKSYGHTSVLLGSVSEEENTFCIIIK